MQLYCNCNGVPTDMGSTTAISQLKWSWYRNAHPLNDIAKFDHASRGVWGSFRLIRSLHVRNLGSLGAAITILAIASDPFIQQIINYHHCQQKSVGEAASIVRTNNYTMDGDSLSMMAAIYQGAYRFFSNVEASCGTGNCTFPEYRTLGVCNACEDITSSLKKVPNGESVEESVQVGWDWVLPSGFSIPGWYSSSMSMKTGNLNSTWKYDDSWNTTSIAITEILSPKYQGVDRGTKVLAVRCSLSPCVRTYRANVTQGVFVEEHVDSCLAKKRKSPGTALMSASFVETPMPCLIDGVYHSASSFTKPNATNNLPMYDMLPGGATAWLPKECVYTLFTPFNMQDYLTDFLTSASNGSRINESPWQWQLFNDGNTSLNMINSTWASIADSMTAHIRRNGNRNYSMPVMGVAEKTLTCISVRWGWIAYPAALLALTFVFLFLTVVESANRARGRIWKSSPLAMLFHGLDGEVAEKYQDVGQVGQMEKLAKQVRVKIKDEGKGLKLVEVSP